MAKQRYCYLAEKYCRCPVGECHDPENEDGDDPGPYELTDDDGFPALAQSASHKAAQNTPKGG